VHTRVRLLAYSISITVDKLVKTKDIFTAEITKDSQLLLVGKDILFFIDCKMSNTFTVNSIFIHLYTNIYWAKLTCNGISAGG